MVEDVIPNSLMREVVRTGQPIMLDIMQFDGESFVVMRVPLKDERGREAALFISARESRSVLCVFLFLGDLLHRVVVIGDRAVGRLEVRLLLHLLRLDVRHHAGLVRVDLALE